MGRIGVLALQGGFGAHERVLRTLGHETVQVRSAEALEGLDGIVLPGGESSAQWKLLTSAGLGEALDGWLRNRRPVLVTCAGVILAAKRVVDPAQPSLGWLDVAVTRNGWGRQVHSFESLDDGRTLRLVFIRAPRIIEVGSDAQVLATLNGEPVLVRQGWVTGATFHPELGGQLEVHREVFGTGSATARVAE